MKNFALLLCFASVSSLIFAQYPEYRITDDGEYQYLSNGESSGTVFDETKGTTYNPITIRTFFLEVQDKGYLPATVTYQDFFSASIKEQREMLDVPFAKPLDCSIGQEIAPGCLVYRHAAAKELLNDNASTKRIPVKRASSRERIDTVKLILHEE